MAGTESCSRAKRFADILSTNLPGQMEVKAHLDEITERLVVNAHILDRVE